MLPLKYARDITVRDRASYRAIQQYRPDAVVRADRALEYLATQKYTPKQPPSNTGLINALQRIPPQQLEQITQQFPGVTFSYIAYTKSDMKYAPKGMQIVYPTTVNQLLEHIASADVLIGQRLHSLICGIGILGTQQTYILGKPYAKKVAALAKQHELSRIGSA